MTWIDKSVKILGLLSFLIFVFYAPSAKGAEGGFPSAERIRLSCTSITPSGAPLWLPYELGLFKEEGLNAELIYVNSATRALSALFAGQTQFTTGGVSTAVQAYMSGGDPVAIAGTVNKMNVSIYSVPEVQLPSELKGKKLGITRLGGLYDFVANYPFNWNQTPNSAKCGGRIQQFDITARIGYSSLKKLDNQPVSYQWMNCRSRRKLR